MWGVSWSLLDQLCLYGLLMKFVSVTVANTVRGTSRPSTRVFFLQPSASLTNCSLFLCCFLLRLYLKDAFISPVCHFNTYFKMLRLCIHYDNDDFLTVVIIHLAKCLRENYSYATYQTWSSGTVIFKCACQRETPFKFFILTSSPTDSTQSHVNCDK